jgi:signal transduction histidine kinase/ActR/RegA family two-component response regulator
MPSGCILDYSTAKIQDGRNQQVRAEQIRLLYANANTGVVVTLLVASVLAYFEWPVIRHPIVTGWLLYTSIVSSARYVLARFYWRRSANFADNWWGSAFTIAAGLSGAGWGAAAILLYPHANLTNQVFLAFVLGGMMLGAVSLLAARLEVFLAFVVPIGLPAGLRLLLDGDGQHLAMGLLATLFTINVLATTWRIHLSIRTSLRLQFENKDLLDDLLVAKEETEALNRRLETRVIERTAELRNANERLQAEIEQRRHAEEDLLRARKLESLGVLVGGIAHDFNNFLTIVLGNIGLATMELERGKPVFDILEQTEGACRRAASLTSQLLTFGKGGAPVRSIVSAVPLIKDAVSLTAAGANVTINCEIADDLWSVEIDASQVSHALQNVLLNARQAMPGGGTIELRAENIHLKVGSPPLNPGKYVRISVQDRGCGIPPDVLPRIFDPYFTTKKTGTGLGLAAAYAIIAKHKGHITVRSAVGVETTFSIFLPASEQDASAKRPAREALLTGSGRILVMDDEDAIRILAARMLENRGYEVAGARDGAEAIALFEKAKATGRNFDAVLLDLTVPGGMGGKECAVRLRALDLSVPLIVSSGYSDDPVLSEFRKYGFDAVLRKPWTVGQLSQVLQQVMRAGSRGAGG